MSEEPKILLHTEVQLIDYGETRTKGPWVSFRLNEPEQLAIFRGMDTQSANRTGHIMTMTISEGDLTKFAPKEPNPNKGPYGDYATKLVVSGFFRAPAVWKAIGTDLQFAAWVQTQPCVVCGEGDWVEELGETRCEAAHVRRADDSGVAHKALYACVPMCRRHHALQHQSGELAAYRNSKAYIEGTSEGMEAREAKEWFDKKRVETVEQWARIALRNALRAEYDVPDSWTHINPTWVYKWAVEKGVERYLPKSSR